MVAIILPLIIFIQPIIIYESNPEGYTARFYTFGLTNFKSATIPEKHKGKNVTRLRGDIFANMYFLKNVSLPDNITEIRGKSFMNDYSLESVKLPSKLTYLGGSSFKNCRSLKSIEIPDSVTQIGGESFVNNYSLVKVKLSKNITEIRGNTFENCLSLKSINIPDSVTRIGGHAFYGNSSLETVNVSEKSQLKEIGSSAFRKCDKLMEIYLPKDTIVIDKAFKESPTNVHRYGEYTYKNYESVFLESIGSEDYVNRYYKNSKVGMDCKIKYIDKIDDGVYYKYIIELYYKGTTKEYTFTNDNSSINIDYNISLKIDKLYFDKKNNYEYVTVDAHFN